jgi:hypothetical protein
MTGCTLKSISSNGLCLICTSVRQASDMVWRRPCTGVMRVDRLLTLAWLRFVDAGAGAVAVEVMRGSFRVRGLRWC